jgi:GNAT superfamily N-acetyltransferase
MSGDGSRAAGLAMAFKLIQSAQDHRRSVSAPHLAALVRAGAVFSNGVLIERAGRGMLDVGYRPAEICLARTEIRPGHQGGGIGTRLISALIDEAGQKGQGLVLDVLTVSRRARRPGSRP